MTAVRPERATLSVMPAPVLTLVPDRLYALGAAVPNDGAITWLPAGAGGFVPLNAYLLTEGRRGILVDTASP